MRAVACLARATASARLLRFSSCSADPPPSSPPPPPPPPELELELEKSRSRHALMRHSRCASCSSVFTPQLSPPFERSPRFDRALAASAATKPSPPSLALSTALRAGCSGRMICSEKCSVCAAASHTCISPSASSTKSCPVRSSAATSYTAADAAADAAPAPAAPIAGAAPKDVTEQ